MSPERSTSIGHERATNHALLEADLEAFVDESASVSTPRPPTTERLVALNRGPWVAARPPLAPLTTARGALVLDVRPVAAFAAGHEPGAVSVALDGGSFATRSAFVLDPAEPFVVRAGNPAEAQEARRLLEAVGLFNALGYLTVDETSETLPTLSVSELALLLDEDDPQILDVREETERTTTVPGSRAIPYRSVRGLAAGALDQDRPVYVICESGQRATLAASLLSRQGYDARAVVGGGVSDVDGLSGPTARTPL